MIISDVKKELIGGKATLSARIEWEQNDFPTQEYYFKTDATFYNDLGNPADAFLCAALIPAQSNGEERIIIDQPVCPTLVDGMKEALFWIRSWYGAKYSKINEVKLDVTLENDANKSSSGSCLFMSGGLDACFSLVHNLENYPEGHPGRIQKALFIGGFDIGGKRSEVGDPEIPAKIAQALYHVSGICNKFNIPLCYVDTNIRHLDDTSGFWGEEFNGAALAACAHAISGLGKHFYLSSDATNLIDNTYIQPYGNHVALTHCYSSYNIELHQYLTHLTSRIKRLEKICEYPQLLESLRVCYVPPAKTLNCGKCEKCVRTMLALNSFGKLDSNAPFGQKLTPELVKSIVIESDVAEIMYKELLESYEISNDHDISEAIKNRLLQFSKYKAWKNESNWKGKLKKLDREFLNSIISRSLNRI